MRSLVCLPLFLQAFFATTPCPPQASAGNRANHFIEDVAEHASVPPVSADLFYDETMAIQASLVSTPAGAPPPLSKLTQALRVVTQARNKPLPSGAVECGKPEAPTKCFVSGELIGNRACGQAAEGQMVFIFKEPGKSCVNSYDCGDDHICSTQLPGAPMFCYPIAPCHLTA